MDLRWYNGERSQTSSIVPALVWNRSGTNSIQKTRRWILILVLGGTTIRSPRGCGAHWLTLCRPPEAALKMVYDWKNSIWWEGQSNQEIYVILRCLYQIVFVRHASRISSPRSRWSKMSFHKGNEHRSIHPGDPQIRLQRIIRISLPNRSKNGKTSQSERITVFVLNVNVFCENSCAVCTAEGVKLQFSCSNTGHKAGRDCTFVPGFECWLSRWSVQNWNPQSSNFLVAISHRSDLCSKVFSGTTTKSIKNGLWEGWFPALPESILDRFPPVLENTFRNDL